MGNGDKWVLIGINNRSLILMKMMLIHGGIRSLSHQTLFPLFKMVIFKPLMFIFPPFDGSFSHPHSFNWYTIKGINGDDRGLKNSIWILLKEMNGKMSDIINPH